MRAYIIVMEDLSGGVVLMDTALDVRSWRREHVDSALKGIAGAHSWNVKSSSSLPSFL